ncbi:CxxxxCH/CxxCH domain-containing protein [Acidovorax sp. sif0715]|nr:CxxxxCH/CxxCH domain-containing protein [Acidovorax sp. sif0732]MBV7448006.1 CxxxxCH/CxxCH domain-containing protein [Acidovorax sp. sif0715]
MGRCTPRRGRRAASGARARIARGEGACTGSRCHGHGRMRGRAVPRRRQEPPWRWSRRRAGGRCVLHRAWRWWTMRPCCWKCPPPNGFGAGAMSCWRRCCRPGLWRLPRRAGRESLFFLKEAGPVRSRRGAAAPRRWWRTAF